MRYVGLIGRTIASPGIQLWKGPGGCKVSKLINDFNPQTLQQKAQAENQRAGRLANAFLLAQERGTDVRM
jgi:hypothetical protein